MFTIKFSCIQVHALQDRDNTNGFKQAAPRAREEEGVWRQRHGKSTQFQLSAFWTLSFHIQTQAVYSIDISMVKRSIHHCSTTRTR